VGGERPSVAGEKAAAGEAVPEGTEIAQEQTTNDEKRDLAIAFGLPWVIAVNAYLSRALAVEAVHQASASSDAGFYGQVTNTGTLTAESGAR
jgi:hypothetical protein